MVSVRKRVCISPSRSCSLNYLGAQRTMNTHPTSLYCINMSARRFEFCKIILICCVVLVAGAGCSSDPQLMATPNMYLNHRRDPFPNVPPELQNNRVEVLY